MTKTTKGELVEVLNIGEEDSWKDLIYTVEGEKFIFIQEYVKTRDAAKAYVRMKGLDERPSNSHKKLGWEIIQRDPILKQIIKSLMTETCETLEITYSGHLKKLAEIRDRAMENDKFAVALNAEIARGKAAGLYVDRKELNVTGVNDLTTNEIEAELKKLTIEAPKKNLPPPDPSGLDDLEKSMEVED